MIPFGSISAPFFFLCRTGGSPLAPRLGDDGHAQRAHSRSSLFFSPRALFCGCLFFPRRGPAVCFSLPRKHLGQLAVFIVFFFPPAKRRRGAKSCPVWSAPAGRLGGVSRHPLFFLFFFLSSRGLLSLSSMAHKRGKKSGANLRHKHKRTRDREGANPASNRKK
nr:hypothetical protein [Pandoravirus belohorizontensis]